MMRNQYEKKFTSATFLNFSNFASFFSCSSLSRSAAPSTYLRGEEDEGNQSLILKTKYVELGLISISSYLLFEPSFIVDVPLPPASEVPHGLVVGCCLDLKKTNHESSSFCHFANAQPEHQWHGGGSRNHPFLPSALDWGGGAGVQVRGGR